MLAELLLDIYLYMITREYREDRRWTKERVKETKTYKQTNERTNYQLTNRIGEVVAQCDARSTKHETGLADCLWWNKHTEFKHKHPTTHSTSYFFHFVHLRFFCCVSSTHIVRCNVLAFGTIRETAQRPAMHRRNDWHCVISLVLMNF